MGFFKRIGQAISGAAKSTREAVSSGTRKVLRKPPREAAPTPAPTPAPAPAEQPPIPAPEAPAPTPEAEAPGEEAEEAEEAPAEAEEEEEGREYYPDSVTITMEGDWQISGNRWEGTIHGSFSGHMVKVVLDMLDTGDPDALATVAAMILPQWDPELGKIIDPWASDIYGADES